MAITPFMPRKMQVGIFTAALRGLVAPAQRAADPDSEVTAWLEFAARIGAQNIQLSVAMHPDDSDRVTAALLDPVADTLDLRKPLNASRATRIRAGMHSSGVGISDLGYFDNMLTHDLDSRARKHALMMRVFDAAVLLGVPAICGFVGHNEQLQMDGNLALFEEVFVPLLKQARARQLVYRVEQCPMPGWTTADHWHNNLAYAPGPWIALHRICERHGVGDQFRIHYDPSHAILMGQDSRSVFQLLKDRGYGFLIDGFHVKGQVIDSRGIAEWGYGGQTLERGDWHAGQPAASAVDRAKSWKKQTVFAEHELPGSARHDPLAYLQNRSVDWLDHQLAARELLSIDPARAHLILEHEFPAARFDDPARLEPILKGSLEFIRCIDAAAAAMHALQHEVLPGQGIAVQGIGREAYRS